MPGDAHNSAVKMITRQFATWKRQSGCDNVEDYAEPNMLTVRSYNPKKKGSGERHPDFSIYGPNRLKPSGSILNHDVPGKSGKHVENPHVVIQFGWANADDSEEYAIDDIMIYTGIGYILSFALMVTSILKRNLIAFRSVFVLVILISLPTKAYIGIVFAIVSLLLSLHKKIRLYLTHKPQMI